LPGQPAARLGEVFAQPTATAPIKNRPKTFTHNLNHHSTVVGLIQIWLSDRLSFCIAEAAPLLIDDFLRGMEPQDGC
jgi:hypothetical protein